MMLPFAATAGPEAGSPEFVELKGDPNESASGLVLVFFSGGSSGGAGQSYSAIDLIGTADADGYYVVGNTGVNEVQELFPGNGLQNGEDAVAKMTTGLSRRIYHGEFTLKRTPQ